MPPEIHYFNSYDVPNEGKITSPIREATREPLMALVGNLHEEFPWLTPNHLTAAGAIFGVAGALIAHRANEEKLNSNDWKRHLAAAFMGLGIAFDALDGPLASFIAAKDPTRPINEMGSIYNSGADSLKEVTQLVVGILEARRAGDIASEAANVVDGMTHKPSQMTFWHTIAEGIDNPETGNNLVQAFGLHTIKIPLSALATAYPRIGKIPLSKIAAICKAGGNITNIGMNVTGIGLPKERTLGEHSKRVGELRRNFHVATSLAMAGVVFGTELYLSKKSQ